MRNIIRAFYVVLLSITSFVFYGCKENADPEQYSPKLYLHTPFKKGVTAKSDIVRSPSSIIMPEDVVEFYVYLSQEQDKDVIVNVVENPDKVKTYNSGAVALPQGTVEFIENNVVIPAGATMSSTTVKARLQQTAAITDLEGVGVVALQITTPSGIDVLSEKSVCYWTVTKQYRNIFSGALEGLSAIENSAFTLTGSTRLTLLRRLQDDRENTQWYCENGGWLATEFKQPTEVKAVAVWPYGNLGNYSGSPRIIELQTSDNGTDWSSLGAVEFALPAAYAPLVLKFYSPVITKHIRAVMVEGYGPTIRIAEIKMY